MALLSSWQNWFIITLMALFAFLAIDIIVGGFSSQPSITKEA